MTENTNIQQTINALRDDSTAFPAKLVESFSDLDPKELDAVMQAWHEVSTKRKRNIMQKLSDRMDDDYVVSFDAFAKAVLHDNDAQVRKVAIKMLWDCGDPRVVPTLIDIAQNDPAPETRAESATVLGSFVYMGELEELDTELLTEIEEALLKAAHDESNHLLQRKAIEALGFSSRPEVPTLLEEAYKHADPQWVASALFAMGRSSDKRWEGSVLQGLVHETDQIRLAAVEAAGELELDSARDIILKAMEEEVDDDILRAEIWSLSQIGGEDVRTYLYNLLDTTEDDDLADFIEEALENLTFTEGLPDLDLNLMNIDPDDVPTDDD